MVVCLLCLMTLLYLFVRDEIFTAAEIGFTQVKIVLDGSNLSRCSILVAEYCRICCCLCYDIIVVPLHINQNFFIDLVHSLVGIGNRPLNRFNRFMLS